MIKYGVGFGSVNILRKFSTVARKQVKALTWNMAAINNNPFGSVPCEILVLL